MMTPFLRPRLSWPIHRRNLSHTDSVYDIMHQAVASKGRVHMVAYMHCGLNAQL